MYQIRSLNFDTHTKRSWKSVKRLWNLEWNVCRNHVNQETPTSACKLTHNWSVLAFTLHLNGWELGYRSLIEDGDSVTRIHVYNFFSLFPSFFHIYSQESLFLRLKKPCSYKDILLHFFWIFFLKSIISSEYHVCIYLQPGIEELQPVFLLVLCFPWS